MKIQYFAAFAALSISACALAAADPASEGAKLYKSKSCAECHETGVGPTPAKIATKYKNDKNAQATLESKVRKGGQGSFGSMPMPPNTMISDSEIKSMVAWILNHK
jgi:cytochrome c